MEADFSHTYDWLDIWLTRILTWLVTYVSNYWVAGWLCMWFPLLGGWPVMIGCGYMGLVGFAIG